MMCLKLLSVAMASFWLLGASLSSLDEAAKNLHKGTDTRKIQRNTTRLEIEDLLHRYEFVEKRRLDIVGSDDRVEFQASKYPWTAVGKVVTSSKSCTGTMVGPSLMLTAQHCLDRNSDGSISWMRLTPAYYDGNAPYGSAMARQAFYDHKNPSNSKYLYEHQFAYDYTVVRLSQPIGDVVGWWQYEVFEPGMSNRVMHIGYGCDRCDGKRPLFHDKSYIYLVKSYFNSIGTESYLMKHVIDSKDGQSGGPIFTFWNGNGPYIIGVHVASANWASGGPGLKRLISNLQSNNFDLQHENMDAREPNGAHTIQTWLNVLAASFVLVIFWAVSFGAVPRISNTCQENRL